MNEIPIPLIALFIYLIFYILARLFCSAWYRLGQRFAMETAIKTLIAKMIFISCHLFGLITALGTLGIDITALVAGLGLTGFALGLAFKDIISNLLAGVLLLIYQPFKIGDRIKMGHYEGQITGIDLRYTQLHTEQGQILIPNMKLFKEVIQVYA